MEILKLVQGSEEWKRVRTECLTASEAVVMMGASPYMSRDDLLKYKTIGDEQEITRFQQIIYDKGHAVEALARPLAEFRCFDGDDLYPVTGLTIVQGLRMLASFDGLVMPSQNDAWEHKQFNKELYALVKSGGELEPKHYWQLEHQAIVANLDRVVFTVSDGTEENCADLIYIPNPDRQAKLIQHWKQFVQDLKNYVPIVIEAKVVAELVETLPALIYETSSTEKGLSLKSNIEEYKIACVALVERSKKKIETDQDFANAESRVKLCKEAEEKIAFLQKQVLSEVVDIDKFTRDLDSISAMLRECRLNEDKQVNQRKEDIRLEVINNRKQLFDAHIKIANDAIAATGHAFGDIKLPVIPVDFVNAIKGKKTVKSLHESANNELARAKAEANRIASVIDANLDLMKKTASEYSTLFADIKTLILKDQEDLKAIAINRIAEHKKQEDERIQAAAQKIADVKIEEAKKEPVKTSTGSGAGFGSYRALAGEQPTLFGKKFAEELDSKNSANSIVDEYFGDPVTSPVVDDSTGQQTLIGREEIIFAVSAHWGVTLAQAELACITNFEPKL